MTDSSSHDTHAPLMRQYQSGDEDGIVLLLNKSFTEVWGTVASWKSKHLDAPAFRPDKVLVFEAGSEVVACAHYVVLPFLAEPGLVLDCSVGADLAVDSKFRRHGLMMVARHTESGWIERDQTPLRLGFSTPEMHEKVYRSNFGHTYLENTSRHCTKMLSTESLRTHVESVATRISSSRGSALLQTLGSVSVRLEVTGFEPLYLRLSPSGANCSTDPFAGDVCRIKMPLELLTAAREGALPLLLRLSQAVLLRRAGIRGWRTLLAWSWKVLVGWARRR